MTEERSDPQTEPAYTGRVLPGSRWRQRAFSGHVEQEVTVLRVGQRSVMLVIEGGGNGGKLSSHDRQKVGQRFNVILDTFLKTHTLLEQPKGYRPGDEALGGAPKKDTVETYFRRRRYAQEWIDTMEGDNIRAATLDPRLPVVPDPVYAGDAFVPPPPPEFPELSPPPPEEEPMSEEPNVITASDEQLLETLHQIEAKEVEYLERPVVAPEPEPDPLEQFLASGRAVVEKLTRELITLADQRDDHLAMAEQLDARYQAVKANRNRIESAVLAAMGTVEEPHVQRHGPVAATQGTQRSWVLDYARAHGGVNVGGVADEFARQFNVTREIAVKNISSILGDQIKKPNANWPKVERADKGIYILSPNQAG